MSCKTIRCVGQLAQQQHPYGPFLPCCASVLAGRAGKLKTHYPLHNTAQTAALTNKSLVVSRDGDCLCQLTVRFVSCCRQSTCVDIHEIGSSFEKRKELLFTPVNSSYNISWQLTLSAVSRTAVALSNRALLWRFSFAPPRASVASILRCELGSRLLLMC